MSGGSDDGSVVGSPAAVGGVEVLAATGGSFPWVMGAVALTTLLLGLYLLAFWRLDHVRARRRLRQ